MSKWEQFQASAIAVYPYSSSEIHHLSIQSGDRLEIIETFGDTWVKAKCMTTSCIGICPRNRIQLLSDDQNNSSGSNEGSFDLLTFEAQILIEHALKNIQSSMYTNEKEVLIFSDIVRIMNLIDISRQSHATIKEENRKIISQCLDNIRKNSDLRPLERRSNYSLVRTHDISIKSFSPELSAEQDQNSFDSQATLTIKFSIPYKEAILVTLTLLDQHNSTAISAPATVSVDKDSNRLHTISLINIDSTYKSQLALSVRIFNRTQYGDKKRITHGHEYIAAGLEKLTFTKEINDLTIPLYRISDASYSEIATRILANNMTDLVRSDEIQEFQLSTNWTESVEAAIAPIDGAPIPTMRLPINLTPQFIMNRLYVNIKMIHQKSKLKKTRVNLSLLDKSQNKFVDCFLNSEDKKVYSSVLQKGLLEMKFDDIAVINISQDFDLTNSYLVFEVVRVANDGLVHLSSYAMYKLFDDSGFISLKQNHVLTLLKPPQAEMDAHSYSATLDTPNAKSPGEGGDLTIDLSIASTQIPSDPSINEILNWQQNIEHISQGNIDLSSIDVSLFSAFLLRLLDCLVSISLSNQENLSNAGVKLLMKTFLLIDKHRSKQLKAFFNYFIENCFNKEHPNYANIYPYIFKYIIDTFPSSPEGMTAQAKAACGECCRTLPFAFPVASASLNLNKELNNISNDNNFQNAVREVLRRLELIIQSQDNDLQTVKSFIFRYSANLCEVIYQSFPEKDGNQIIVEFFKRLNLRGINSGEASLLFNRFFSTTYFSIESNRRIILPEIVALLKSLLKPKDGQTPVKQSVVLAYIRTIFFVAMQNSESFPDELSSLSDFIYYMIPEDVTSSNLDSNMMDTQTISNNMNNKFASNRDQFYFSVIFLYFCNEQSIANVISQHENQLEFFISILHLIYETVKGRTIKGDSKGNTADLIPPPSYILYICPITFIKLVSFSKHKEFSFIHKSLNILLDLIANFYNDFLESTKLVKPCDQSLFDRIYITNLEPIAALLPQLLENVPKESRFNESVFKPLFHFYVNQNDPKTREQIQDGFLLLLQSDLDQMHSFVRSENAAIPALDDVLQSNPGNAELRDLVKNTHAKFGKNKDDPVVVTFFKRLDELTRYMLDLGRLPEDAQHEDERSTAILSILDACKAENQFLIPVLTSKLYDLHILMNNHTEAAETLLQCAETLSWDDHDMTMKGFGYNESQEKCERKRLILHDAVRLFMKSMFYERALDVLGMLEDYYRDINIDYGQLADVHKLQSECWSIICDQERNILNRFYGVRFYGNLQPAQYYKPTVYVYRRDGFFMSDKMIMNLKEKFPDVEVSPVAPTEEQQKALNFKYIHVFNLKPKDITHFDILSPPSQMMVESCCGFQEFYSERSYTIKREGKWMNNVSKDARVFAQLHMDTYKYTTSKPFQNIVRRLEVAETSDLITLYPIQCAVNDINVKTIELVKVASMYWRCLRYNLPFNQTNTSNFTRLVSGIVDAAVNGGTKIFQDLFLVILKDDKENIDNAPKLKLAFIDQAKIVNFAVKIHPYVIADVFMPLHERICESFEQMIKTMEEVIGHIDLDEDPSFCTIPPMDFIAELPKAPLPQIQAHAQQLQALLKTSVQAMQANAQTTLTDDIL